MLCGGLQRKRLIVDLHKKYPDKPILVAFSGDKGAMDQYKAALEPQGIPTYQEIEQPFAVLSIMERCYRAMNRPE